MDPPANPKISSSAVRLDMAPIGDRFAQGREAANQRSPSRAKNCAECRRLKVKCDRNIPCQNCIRKGCAAICPDGSLSSRGSRLVLSNTEDLHAKIEEMTARILELEAALASLQAQISTEPHPLLLHTVPQRSRGQNEDPLSAFGSIMIDEEGSSCFFGATSSAEYVIPVEREPEATGPANTIAARPMDSTTGTPKAFENPLAGIPDIALIDAEFPHLTDPTRLNRQALKLTVVQSLPSKEDGLQLIELYYRHVAWDTNPVARPRLFSDLFGPCYENPYSPSLSNHSLALLYAVFALGMLYHPQSSDHSHQYFTLSRAAMMIDDIVLNATLTTIDALILHIVYIRMAEGPGYASRGWTLLGSTMKLAQTLGLHRDPSFWCLTPEETYRRRKTMWELAHLDLWSALYAGRPPMLSRQHFDVQIPMDDSVTAEADPNYNRGKYLFCDACVWPLLDVALASNGRTSYAAVLKMDKKIRDWRLPIKAQVLNYVPTEDQRKGFVIQRAIMFIVREVTILALHRSYFACSLSEPPFEPLRSRYSRSVLAAYAGACAILVRIRKFHEQEPGTFKKMAFFGVHGFTAAIVLGSLAARAPDCPLAASALVEFDYTVDLFSALQDVKRARLVLPVLRKLQTQAHDAMQAYREGRWTQPTVDDPVLFSGMGGTKNVIRPMYEYLPNSSKNTVSGDLGQTTDGVTMSQPNQIYLDDYVRSFGGYKTSSGVSSSIGTSAPSPMHIQSSDAFLLGALTGDWSMAAGSTEAALLGTSIDLSTYGVPSKTRERQRADQVQHPQSVFHVGNRISEPQNSGSTDYKPWNAASNSVVPNPTIHPRYNRDDTHVGPSHGRFFTSSTVPQGGPFSSQSDMWSSSFAPTTHHPSMSLHPASNGPEVGSTGERGHAADEGDAVTFVFPAFDTQTAALWDDFLIGLGVDHTVI